MTLDFGMAVHPRDAEKKEGLIDAADKQLYALRSKTGISRVIPMEAPAASRTAPREGHKVAAAPADLLQPAADVSTPVSPAAGAARKRSRVAASPLIPPHR